MKSSTVVLFIMVTLSLVFSLTALLIIANDHGFFTPSYPSTSTAPNQATQPPTHNTPKPTTILSNAQLTIQTTQTPKENLKNDISKVNYTITLTYQKGNALTIDYNDFYLELSITRTALLVPGGTTQPQNSGTIALSPSHPTETFLIQFQFPTTQFNGMDTGTVYYTLKYNGSGTVQWVS